MKHLSDVVVIFLTIIGLVFCLTLILPFTGDYKAYVTTTAVVVLTIILGVLLTIVLITFADSVTDNSKKEDKLHGVKCFRKNNITFTQLVLGKDKVTIQVRSGDINNTVPCAGICMFERVSERDEDNLSFKDKNAVMLLSTSEQGFDVLLEAITAAKQEFIQLKNS